MNTMAISKGAEDAGICWSPAFFYGSAREGFRDLLLEGSQWRSDVEGVLLPAYIGWSAREGSGVFDPVRESGRPHRFYDVNDDLSANTEHIAELLGSGLFSHLVLIHYFGRLDPARTRIYALAKEHRVVVVDDLAHAFFTAQRPNASLDGDVRLYSLHKQFPMESGGMVQYQTPGLVRNQVATRPEFANTVAGYDWGAIAVKRRSNYFTLLEELRRHCASIRGWRPMWDDLEPEQIPQTLPLIVDPSRRDSLYFSLNQMGFGAVSLYHTLIPEAQGVCAKAEQLSSSILNLPIHQDCDAQELGRMACAFARCMNPGRTGEPNAHA